MRWGLPLVRLGGDNQWWHQSDTTMETLWVSCSNVGQVILQEDREAHSGDYLKRCDIIHGITSKYKGNWTLLYLFVNNSLMINWRDLSPPDIGQIYTELHDQTSSCSPSFPLYCFIICVCLITLVWLMLVLLHTSKDQSISLSFMLINDTNHNYFY